MGRRAVVLFTVMAAALLACAGIVSAQGAERETGPASAAEQAAKSDVIPGRYIVVLEDDGDGRTEGPARAQTGARAGVERRQAQEVAGDLAREDKVREVSQAYGAALKGFAAEIPAGKVGAVRSDPRVAFVAEDREVHATAQPLPTGIDRVDTDVDTNSVVAGNGSGAVEADIAILDSGIYANHPDLNVAGGKDCSRDGKSTFSDDDGHGSHVAGTAAARDNTIGVVGTAPGARLWAVKVLEADGSGSFSDIICGIDWVTQNAATIDVANMSLGARTTTNGTADDGECGDRNRDALHRAICASVAARVPYVVSAGNDDRNASNYVPAAYDEVITVSALADYNGLPNGGAPSTCLRAGADDRFANFSNFGPDVDIGAPGVCIRSTWKAVKKGKRKVPGYRTISGTSMASPHVAGAAAVYLDKNPSATPDGVREFMVDPGNSEDNQEGHVGLNPEPVLQMGNY